MNATHCLSDYRGLAYRSPLLGGVLAFFLISLIGIPFTGGFFGKFYVFAAALHSGMVWLAILGLVNSGIAAYYYLRLLTTAYTKPDENLPMYAIPRITMPMLVALLLTVAATLVLGIAPGRILARAQAGAATYPQFAPKTDCRHSGGCLASAVISAPPVTRFASAAADSLFCSKVQVAAFKDPAGRREDNPSQQQSEHDVQGTEHGCASAAQADLRHRDQESDPCPEWTTRASSRQRRLRSPWWQSRRERIAGRWRRRD